MSEEESMGGEEAVYYSALSSLDALKTDEERAMVVINWVKYILLTEAASIMGDGDLLPTFRHLCRRFAVSVMGLPRLYKERHDAGLSCGLCAECKASIASKRRNEVTVILGTLEELKRIAEQLEASERDQSLDQSEQN